MEGTRVALRPMTLDDTADVVRWRSDPFVFDNLFGDVPPTSASHRQWFERMQVRGDRHEFIILEQPTRRPIGTIGLSDIDQANQRAEYGILIGEAEARGQGYAYDSSQLVLQYAFNELRLHRVYLHVFVDNLAAVKLYRRIGFQVEGTLRQHIYKRGTFRDAYVMGILTSEWKV